MKGGDGFRRPAWVCAAIAFGGTSLLALAAADWPPPAGFLLLEVMLAALSGVVYIRIRSRLAARARGRSIPVAALEGVLAGLFVGLLFLAVHGGDPDIRPVAGDHIVWMSALAVVGGVVAQVLWVVAVWIARVSPAPPAGRASIRHSDE